MLPDLGLFFMGGGGSLDARGTILAMSLHRGPKYADQAVIGRSRGVLLNG